MFPFSRAKSTGRVGAGVSKVTSFSARDGALTVRETAAQTLCRSCGVQSSRALGSTSKPVYWLYSTFEPSVRRRRSPSNEISSCTKALARWIISSEGLKATAAELRMSSAVKR